MKRAGIASALVLAGLTLAGCASEYGYDRVGYGYGYDGYPGYYDGYGPGYGGYYGWYGDYYYPGSGIFVYDRYRRPYRWNGAQQRYWQGQLNGYRGPRGGPEWHSFAGGPGSNGQPGYGGRGYGQRGYHGAAPSGDGRRGGGAYGYHR